MVEVVCLQCYTFYIFGALCANEFIGPNGSELGHFYDCPYSNDPLDPACKQYTGRYIMESLGMPSHWIWRPVVVLVAFAVAHYVSLRWSVTPIQPLRH